MERVQQGDRDAFGLLYDAISPTVFGTIRRVLRDPAMSEEVTQEVFVEIWRTAPRFDRARAGVSTWATTMARRRAIDRVRAEQSRRTSAAELGRQRDDASTDPADSVVASFGADRVGRAVAELPDDQRAVIEMAFIEGLPHTTIAERLDLPLGTVKGRVRGGLRRLRGIMGAET
jgi:RNA polymerase sigma-70 factor (ECF subfamily)